MNPFAVRFGCSVLALASAAFATPAADDLAAGFAAPPAVAKPHTWWHWMNGNVTKEGITADLEAMKRIGLGGAQIFNVFEDIPEGPVAYNSPAWREMVKHAASEADRLGLELCIHNCAGWSSSGGPWVQPQDAMQTVVTTETAARGPVAFSAALPQPRTSNGFYRDIAVLAFPTPKDNAARIADIGAKALTEYRYGVHPSLAPTPADAAIKRDSIVDLTSKFKDGQLRWEVPAGDWTIMRIGHTPTGAVNAPAPAVGRGLEVDKLSREAFDRFWAGGMAPLIKELGPLAGKSLRNVLIDSYEVGCQNWSPKFREDFTRLRGYDPLLYLPALTGRIIEGGDVSERFLWDMRRTVGDLFTENYYKPFAETCRKNGLLSSVEPYDGPFECTQVARDADIVMGEFWVNSSMQNSCKLASSVAHTFGKAIVGSESFTAEPGAGRWLNHPASLKAVGDLIWCEGVNRFIIHRYAHQPWLNIEPGMTMGQWGTHFERTTTWWEHGGPEWVEYLTRSQYLLQAGKPTADVLMLSGDCAPNGAPFDSGLKAAGFDYDACGPDALRGAVVKGGRIVLASGASYGLLTLPETTFMTPELLDRVVSLVGEGLPVIGPSPTNSPSLRGFPASDKSVREKAVANWASFPTSPDAPLPRRALSGVSAERMLAALKMTPDATFKTPGGAKPVTAWIHRIVGDTDIYFVSNQKARSEEIECSLRVTGKNPELWHAESGRIEPAPFWRVENGRTIVTTRFDPAGSVFIVLRPGTEVAHATSVQGPGGAAQKLPKIEIRKARYEAVDGAGGTDVTAAVAALVAQGQTEIAAVNSAFGDPAFNHLKRLTVEFVLGGVAATRTVQENATLVLAEMGPESPATYALTSGPAGIQLHAWLAGDYTVRTNGGAEHTLRIPSLPAPVTITGAWSVAFQPHRGAPPSVTLDTLHSWSTDADPGVKYFSGTAVYEKSFALPESFVAGTDGSRSLLLDLGNVHEIAEVQINGKPVRTLWKPPYTVDISGLAVAGSNRLTVKVTNLWVNRLIGDEQFPEDTQWARPAPSPLTAWPEWFAPKAFSASGATLKDRPVKERLTFTTWKHWTKDSPLIDSGLIGPVMVRVGERRAVPSGK